MPAAIEVEHLTKEYRLGKLTSLRSDALNAWRRLRGLPVEERQAFKALDDVSFTVQAGEVVGIIGHNGAGKSTLLKILSRIITPTRGAVRVHGRVAPLIEVGAGLVGDLTGRENIYLNAAILGMKRAEVDRKFDAIVAFTELEEFIDTPIKRYSTGMQVRLGFSIATSVEAEILIVDEVLAVGDLAFQRKCFDRMEELIRGEGRTVLLVSHNIRQVERLCSRVMLMDHGRVAADGAPADTCTQFYQQSNTKVKALQGASLSANARIRGSGEVDVVSVEVLDERGRETTEIKSGGPLVVRAQLQVNQPLRNAEVIVGTHTTDFVYLTAHSPPASSGAADLCEGFHTVTCTVPRYPMAPGVYCVRVAIFDQRRRMLYAGETLKVFAVAPDKEEGRRPQLRLVDLDASWSVDGERHAELSTRLSMAT